MTTKTWDNSTNSFFNAADWSPTGTPQSGDTAIINAGTVGVSGTSLQALTVQIKGSSSASPTLALTDAVVGVGTVLASAATSGTVRINAAGTVVNQGVISFTGPTTAQFTTSLANGANGVPGLLQNLGSIAAIDASPYFVATAAGQAFENDGAISLWNPSRGFQIATIGPAVTGTGTILMDAYTQAELVQGVGAGQAIQFLNGTAGHALLQIDQASGFHGTMSGFVQSDTLTLVNAPYTGYSYSPTDASHGVLTLTNGSAPVASLAFSGAYQTSDFNLGFTDLGGGRSITQITTTAASSAQAFNITDVTLGQSTTDQGTAYNGPVSYLQHQFIWNSPDGVAIATSASNSFLHGGSGDDALAVSSGQNVLDGGGGSNFLVGGNGADGGADTFFVDGRGGVVTWSTIVNFHHGDMATVFGFTAGTSTLPLTASDGAAGYQGATIHSELGGAGTGVNGSVTFAGLSLADVQNKLTMTTGNVGGANYLLISYTG